MKELLNMVVTKVVSAFGYVNCSWVDPTGKAHVVKIESSKFKHLRPLEDIGIGDRLLCSGVYMKDFGYKRIKQDRLNAASTKTMTVHCHCGPNFVVEAYDGLYEDGFCGAEEKPAKRSRK